MLAQKCQIVKVADGRWTMDDSLWLVAGEFLTNDASFDDKMTGLKVEMQ
jgi:hypothetical protein